MLTKTPWKVIGLANVKGIIYTLQNIDAELSCLWSRRRQVLGRVAELANDSEAIGRVELLGVRVHSARRCEVGHAEELAEAFEPMPKDGEASLVFGIERPAEVVQECGLGLVLLDARKVFPFPGLGCLDERNHIPREEAALRVVSVPVALFVTACRDQVVFDGGLECVFGMLARHQASSVTSRVASLSRTMSQSVAILCRDMSR
ncbi:MAG: hypothetical protein V1789_12620 [PVC group bacterium]